MFYEVLQIAFASLRANKLRSALTMLGIVIGIGSVIAVVALGTGAKQAVQERIAKLGTTLLQVNAQRIAQGGVQLADAKRMTMADVKMLEERATKLTAIQPQQDQRLMVQYGRQNSQSSVTGTTPNFLEVRKYKLAAGRMFTSQDNEARRRVTLLGATPLANLGITEPTQIIGELVRIRGLQFEVIGVLAPKGQVSGFGDPDDQVLIPFETGRWRVFGTDRLNDINLLAMHEDSVNAAMEEVASIMRRAHKLRPGKPDDFTIRNQADFLNTLGATTEVFTYLLSGIATVSLLVGGIGIMNIMLVSVTERTREIGIRKALGATRLTILTQFLAEAVTLCLFGGVIGVAVGAGTAWTLRTSFGWSTVIVPSSIVTAFVFSGLVGVLFGVWPARRAARLDPIIALRYE
ncbi:MAG: MacB-like periplasmic core domain protein [Gemmatimonadetes bacterium]|nr:MacB-like periplasmic core domain protein [Gemmatimonadota bacterium]